MSAKFIGRRVCATVVSAFAFAAVYTMIPSAVHAGEYEDGVKLYGEHKYSDALGKFTTSFVGNREPANSLYYQGLCLQQLGQPDGAKVVYTKLVTKYGASGAAVNARLALKQLSGAQPVVAAAASASAPLKSGADAPLNCEIPFSDTKYGMVVPVQVNGHWLAAIWDTGAAPIYFTKSQLEVAGVETKGATKAGSVQGVGGEIQTSRLVVPVMVGNQKFLTPILIEDDTARQRNADDVSFDYGLLGEEFFGKYIYEVDPNAHVIRLLQRTNVDVHQRKRVTTKAGGNEVPFRWEDGQIVVTAKVNGRECEMIFDTGAHSVSFNDKQLTAIGMTRPTSSARGYALGVGGIRQAFGFALTKVQLGPISKAEVAAGVDVYGTQTRPLLGQSFLGGLKYRIDPERCVITFRD